MTLLATKVGLKEAFRALRMTFAGRQFPARRTFYALIATRTAARVTTQIAFYATAAIAVISENGNENVNFCGDMPRRCPAWWIFNGIDIVKLNRVIIILFCSYVTRRTLFHHHYPLDKLNSLKFHRRKVSTGSLSLILKSAMENFLFTHPSAQVERHSPLCSCNPFTHSVQFMRETHCVQVCKQRVQIPASMKYPLSHVFTHLLFWRSRLLEQVRQSFSVGPMQVSQVEWHEWQRPLSKYSAEDFYRERERKRAF